MVFHNGLYLLQREISLMRESLGLHCAVGKWDKYLVGILEVVAIVTSPALDNWGGGILNLRNMYFGS